MNEVLLKYRKTWISGINLSPSQILLSRNVRTCLPITQTSYKKDQFNKKLISKQKQAKFYSDRHAQERPEFVPGKM